MPLGLSENHEISHQQIFQLNRQATHDLHRYRHESPVRTEGLVENICQVLVLLFQPFEVNGAKRDSGAGGALNHLAIAFSQFRSELNLVLDDALLSNEAAVFDVTVVVPRI